MITENVKFKKRLIITDRVRKYMLFRENFEDISKLLCFRALLAPFSEHYTCMVVSEDVNEVQHSN